MSDSNTHGDKRSRLSSQSMTLANAFLSLTMKHVAVPHPHLIRRGKPHQAQDNVSILRHQFLPQTVYWSKAYERNPLICEVRFQRVSPPTPTNQRPLKESWKCLFSPWQVAWILKSGYSLPSAFFSPAVNAVFISPSVLHLPLYENHPQLHVVQSDWLWRDRINPSDHHGDTSTSTEPTPSKDPERQTLVPWLSSAVQTALWGGTGRDIGACLVPWGLPMHLLILVSL